MLSTVVQALLAFIVVIGILVTVHEFGHYWVARRLGVKILRFSVGFGQPLWKRTFGKDKTEFVVAAIPLGGYVKMLDEREGEVAKEELPRAFNQQPLKVRAAIVVAGPLSNFLFAILAYTVMYMVGVTGMKALVADITPQSLAAQAQLQPGQQIIAVNKESATRWDSVIQATLKQVLDGKTDVTFMVHNAQGYQSTLTLNLQGLSIDDIAQGQFFVKLGIKPFRPPWPAMIGEIVSNSAAEKAGLKQGDKIISLDNQPIENWEAWANYVSQRPGQDIYAKIERNQQTLDLVLNPALVNGKGRMGVYAPYFVTESYTLWPAFKQGIVKTWDMSVLTLRMMFKMLFLQVSHEHISGPITIAQFAGQTAQIGLFAFLSFLGLVSVSLGIINLLPIPLLDGGHLFFYFVEWVKGNPVTENMEMLFQRIGLTLILGLMILAIFNDIDRLFN